MLRTKLIIVLCFIGSIFFHYDIYASETWEPIFSDSPVPRRPDPKKLDIIHATSDRPSAINRYIVHVGGGFSSEELRLKWRRTNVWVRAAGNLIASNQLSSAYVFEAADPDRPYRWAIGYFLSAEDALSVCYQLQKKAAHCAVYESGASAVAENRVQLNPFEALGDAAYSQKTRDKYYRDLLMTLGSNKKGRLLEHLGYNPMDRLGRPVAIKMQNAGDLLMESSELRLHKRENDLPIAPDTTGPSDCRVRSFDGGRTLIQSASYVVVAKKDSQFAISRSWLWHTVRPLVVKAAKTHCPGAATAGVAVYIEGHDVFSNGTVYDTKKIVLPKFRLPPEEERWIDDSLIIIPNHRFNQLIGDFVSPGIVAASFRVDPSFDKCDPEFGIACVFKDFKPKYFAESLTYTQRSFEDEESYGSFAQYADATKRRVARNERIESQREARAARIGSMDLHERASLLLKSIHKRYEEAVERGSAEGGLERNDCVYITFGGCTDNAGTATTMDLPIFVLN